MPKLLLLIFVTTLNLVTPALITILLIERANAVCRSYDKEDWMECDPNADADPWSSPKNAHDPDCQAAWFESSARQSCSTTDWIEASDTRCRIIVQCSVTERTYYSEDKSYVAAPKVSVGIFDVQDVPELKNCEGTLKIKSC